MKKTISAPDYQLYLAIIQNIEKSSMFEKLADNVYYFDGVGITIVYSHKEEEPMGNLTIYSPNEERLSKFEKKVLGLLKASR